MATITIVIDVADADVSEVLHHFGVAEGYFDKVPDPAHLGSMISNPMDEVGFMASVLQEYVLKRSREVALATAHAATEAATPQFSFDVTSAQLHI